MAKYWPEVGGSSYVVLELRANIALRLIEHNTSTVAGKLDDREDSAGRARITLQSPDELVTRAFNIADTFVDAAEKRGDIRPAPTDDELIAATEARLMAKRAKRAELLEKGTKPPEDPTA